MSRESEDDLKNLKLWLKGKSITENEITKTNDTNSGWGSQGEEQCFAWLTPAHISQKLEQGPVGLSVNFIDHP